MDQGSEKARTRRSYLRTTRRNPISPRVQTDQEHTLIALKLGFIPAEKTRLHPAFAVTEVSALLLAHFTGQDQLIFSGYTKKPS